MDVESTISDGRREASMKLASAREISNGGNDEKKYEWKFEKPKRIVPANQVRDIILSLKSDYDSLRAKKPVLTDDEIRDELKRIVPAYEQLTETHARMFSRVTSRDNISGDDFGHVMRLINLKVSQEENAGTVKEHTEQVSTYFNRHFTKSESEVRKQWAEVTEK